MHYSYYSAWLDDDLRIHLSDGFSDDYSLPILHHIIKTSEPIAFAWDLDEFTAIILRELTTEELHTLSNTERVFVRPFSIFYRPEKMLSIKAGATEVVFYELQQYFPGEMSEPENPQGYVKKLIDGLTAIHLEHAGKFTSPIGIFKDTMMKHINLPSWDMPEDAMIFADACSGKGWIEAFKVGYWECANDYDLKGAYPTAAMGLYDTRQLQWYESSEYQGEALYGYTRGKITINPNVTVHPFMFENTGKWASVARWFTPVGEWWGYFTKAEIDFLNRWQLGSYEIEAGWWGKRIKPEYEPQKPLEKIMRDILTWKSHPLPVVQDFGKQCAVGLYGLFGAIAGDTFGPNYNPCWFAEISSQARLQVCEFIYRHKLMDSLIHISTDGVLLDREIVLGPQNGRWQWKHDYFGPVIVLDGHLRFLRDLEPQGITLEDLQRMIRGNPRSHSYTKTIPQVVRIAEALNHEPRLMGVKIDRFSTINLRGLPHKRKFEKLPRRGEDVLSNVYNSKPIEVHEERPEHAKGGE